MATQTMTCSHRPISNGWSSSRSATSTSITTWCGRCKENVPVDEEWVKTYYERKRTRARGEYAGSRLQRIIDDIDADERYGLGLVRGETL